MGDSLLIDAFSGYGSVIEAVKDWNSIDGNVQILHYANDIVRREHCDDNTDMSKHTLGDLTVYALSKTFGSVYQESKLKIIELLEKENMRPQ